MLKGAAVGVLANQASIDTRGHHLAGLLKKSSHCKLTKLFAPEHGFFGDAQDMDSVSDVNDPSTGIEIISLYGQTAGNLSPTVENFAGLDALVVDLPDIGTRYYTFSQTMAYCMKVAGAAGVKVIVLDRPNPIGGAQIEGSPLTKAYRSFCGIGPIANRHGMTLGELAALFRGGFGEGEAAIEKHNCELEIIQVKGWQRSMYLDETSIPWVPPSPNMQSLETAGVYPGACLFEATNLSEGRGTSRPFELLGAPFVDPAAWIAATRKVGIPLEGVSLRAVEFTPQFQKYAGELCRGVQIHVDDRLTFKPYRFGIALLVAAAKTFPDDFKWRKQPYEFIDDVPAVDLLYGDDSLRNCAEGCSSIEGILKQMEDFERWYKSARKQYLRY
ncbi:MAG: DUF1343 domain-containing protein [Verrucomicrobia bacterium]|nr:DUF1343 domain-containing protein [Verrucomicrobiota bacterium]